MTCLKSVDSNRQIMRWNDLMSQTMQDPSEEALTAFYLQRVRILNRSYLIVVFSYLDGPDTASVFLHAGFHYLALFAESEDADFAFASTTHYSLTVTCEGDTGHSVQMGVVYHVHQFTLKIKRCDIWLT